MLHTARVLLLNSQCGCKSLLSLRFFTGQFLDMVCVFFFFLVTKKSKQWDIVSFNYPKMEINICVLSSFGWLLTGGEKLK